MSRSLFLALAASVTVGGLAAVVATARVLRRVPPARARLLACIGLLGYAALLALRPVAWPIIDLAVLAAAVGGVHLLAGGLRSPGAVATFLVVAAVVDVVSMSGGLSRQLLERYRTGGSDLLLYLTLVVPLDGKAIPIVGIGDLLVGGAAATALLRLGRRPLVVMATLAMGLVAALVYGFWRGGAPALPFIALAVIGLVWRRSSRPAERRRHDAACLGLLSAFVVARMVARVSAGPTGSSVPADWRSRITQWIEPVLGAPGLLAVGCWVANAF